MSGPKGYDYAVRAAELERQRAVSDAQARCLALREQALSDAAEAAAFGDEQARAQLAPRISADATAEEAAAAVSRYAHHAREVAARRDTARTAAVLRSFAAHVPKELEGRIDLSWGSPGADAPGTERSASAVDGADEVLARLIETLAHVRDEAARDAWLARATALAMSPSASLVKAKSLSLEVHTRLRQQRQREVLAAEAAEIALTLAGIESPTAEAARDALMHAADRSSLRTAAAQARTARAEHDAAVERRFVIDQTIEALAEIGYEVDEEFRTTALAGGFAVAPRDGLADHALQLRFDPGSGRLLTNTVALREGTSAAADVAAETATCADIDTMGERLQRDGVTLTRFHAARPGAVPIEHRADIARTGPAASRRRAQQSKQREAGR